MMLTFSEPSVKNLLDLQHAVPCAVVPRIAMMKGALVPPMSQAEDKEWVDEAQALLEWLALLSLDSPRVSHEDSIDPFLSRYEVPDFNNAEPTGVIRVRWQGLLPAQWVTNLWLSSLWVPSFYNLMLSLEFASLTVWQMLTLG